MTTRREFLTALGAGALGAAFPAFTQGPIPRVCWTSPTSAAEGSAFFEELRRGFGELGYVEGRNFLLEPNWAEGAAQVEKMIAGVIASKPALIVAQGNSAPQLAKANTGIPVVFGYSGDPIEAGLVESFNRPGRNMTGISYMALDLVGKRMELTKEVLPAVKRVAVVASPTHPGDRAERRASEDAAAKLGLSLEYFELRGADNFGTILPAIEKARAQAVVLFPTQTVIGNSERIAAWSAKARIPAVSGWARFAEGGNLMSYGPNLRTAMRRLAFFGDRVLKGTKPADLPVELPNAVELVVNRGTARTLGIRVPRAVLVRADRVIE